MGCAIFSRGYVLHACTLVINQKCLAVLWMLASFLRCNSTLNLTVRVSTSRHLWEASKRWGRLLSQSSWDVHCSCGQSAFTVDTLTVDSRVA